MGHYRFVDTRAGRSRGLIPIEKYSFGQASMLSGKSAIETGSTSGIGRAIARALAGNGANVMLNGFGDAYEIERTRQDLAAENNVKVIHSGANIALPTEVAKSD
jgi:NAD(P)-dependent dehydrogenase (short-subunit alcohol dehydrogenase family)